MGNIPLPALSIRQQPDMMEQFGKAMQLKQLMAAGQMQQIQLKQAQQQQDDQEKIKALFQQNGGDLDKTIAAAPQAGVTPNTIIALQNHSMQVKTQVATLTKDKLANGKQINDNVNGVLQSVLGASDKPTAYAQARQQMLTNPEMYGITDPSHVPPEQYPGDDALKQQLATHQGADQLFNQEMKRRELAATEASKGAETRKNTAEAQKAELENQAIQQYGGLTQPMADSKYRFLQQKIAANQPITPDDQTFVKAYEKQKLLVPVASANVRVAGMEQAREYPVINKQTGEMEMRNAAEINASKGNFAPAGEGSKAMGKTALIEDIRGNIGSVREALQNPKMPEFTAGQRAEIAIAMGKPDSQDALSAAFRGGVLGSLQPEQQDYLIKMAQLKENAMAMRSVLGAGQGSEDMRAAINATIPGPRTPSKVYALKQLEQFEAVLNRLERGIPNVPLRPAGAAQPTAGETPSGNTKKPTTPGSFNWNDHPKVNP